MNKMESVNGYKKKLRFEIFPYFLVRMGNGNFKDIQRLNFSALLEGIDQYLLLEANKKNIKDNLCEYLYRKIEVTDDVKDQNILLNLKRDIYNDRIKNEQTTSIESCFDSEHFHVFQEYQIYLKDLIIKKVELDNLYKREEEQIKGAFKKMIDNENLKNGLLLSSGVVYEELNKFLLSLNNDTKKGQQLELSLLKYISRIYTKTSPFGLFTNIGYGRIKKCDYPYSLSKDDTYSTQEKIRINNFIFRNLNYLWFNNQRYNRFFHLKKNITVKKENNHYDFMHCIGGASAFQTIESNEFLDYLFEFPFDKGKINIESLTLHLIEKGFFEESELNALENYLYDLIKAGFLEYDIGIIGSDPFWLKKTEILFFNLNKIPRANFDETLEFLHLLDTLFNNFEAALPDQRKNILHSLSLTINNYTQKLEGEIKMTMDKAGKSEEQEYIFHFSKINILKIDNKLNNELFFNTDIAKPIMYKLNELIGFVRNFDYFKKDREIAKDFFVKKYSSKEKISLLQFYKDFFRDYKLPLEEAKLKPNIDVKAEFDFKNIELSIKKEFESFNAKANDFFSNKLKTITDSGEVHFSLDEIKKELFSQSPIESVKGSWGSHVQIYSEVNEKGETTTKSIVNSIFPGYGKLSSRFLYLFDDIYSTLQYDWNSRLAAKNELLVENKDNNYFNANIHPRMMPYELYTPGIKRNMEEHEISINDFEVCFDEKINNLIVRQKTTKKIVNFFDLGFELDAQRSNLFWFINLFSFSEWPNLFPILNSINSRYDKKFNPTYSQISFKPRIICDNDLILQRKTWIIEKSVLPFPKAGESTLEYFLKVKEWQKKLSIPDNIFISIPKQNIEDRESKKVKMVADDYKPLYISLKSPLFVKLFLKIINRAEDKVKISEMLPNLDLANKNNLGDSYPNEFLFQWYSYEN